MDEVCVVGRPSRIAERVAAHRRGTGRRPLKNEGYPVGCPSRTAERVAACRESGATTLIVAPPVNEAGEPAKNGLETLRRACS